MEAATNDSVEANQVTKCKRGKTRGTKWKKIRDQRGGRLPVAIPASLRRVVGENAQQFITETSYLVKQCLPLRAKNWAAIDRDLKAKLINYVGEMYVLPNEARVNYALKKMFMKRYSDWRYTLRKRYRSLKTDQEHLANCPGDIDPNDWKWLVEEHWGTQKFRHISEVNTKNREKQKMLACVGTKSVARTLHEMRNSNDEQDEIPEYLKLFLKEKKKKCGTWVDNEAEAAYKKMEELHAAQIEQYGTDNLTTVEVYPQVLGHRSGHVRGMGVEPPPLKRINDCGQHTSHNCVTEASVDARIESELKERFTEFSKKKEEEMNQRFEEFSKKREDEIRKQVQTELEDKIANKLRAEMKLLMSEKLASFQESQTSTSKNQSSSPEETTHAISDKRGKDEFHYNCTCGLRFKDAETYMVHLRNPEHHKRMENLNKALFAIPSTINVQETKSRMIKKGK